MARGLLSRLSRRLRREAADARLIGTGTFKQHLSRLLRRPECSVSVAGAGRISIRPGEPDLASFRRIFVDQEYRIPVASAQAAVSKRYEVILAGGRTPVIVDAGAYVGASTLWFRSQFPRAHIVAIEPDPASFALLERNLSAGGATTAIQAAVGASPGQVRLVGASEPWATQVERSSAGVEVVTMNGAFATVPQGVPFLAKINIEGFEDELFSGALEWLDEICVLLVEPHDWLLPGRHTSRSLQKAMGERDFHLFINGPHLCYVRL